MSTTSPREAAAETQATLQGQQALDLSQITMPELAKLLGGLQSSVATRDPSGRLAMDAGVLSSAKGELNQSYNQAQFGSQEAINYGSMRAGESRLSPGATNSAVMGAATGLERDRQSALRNLEFMSSQSSMADYNQVLSLLGQGANASLGLAQGYSGIATNAIGGLSGTSQMSGTLGGAASGAASGAALGPWGALAGGVIGGLTGYLGSG